MKQHYEVKASIGNLKVGKCGSCGAEMVHNLKLTGRVSFVLSCDCCGHNTCFKFNNPDLTVKDTSHIGKPMVIHKPTNAEKIEAKA